MAEDKNRISINDFEKPIMNTRIQYIDENDINGIVIIDFATEELVKKIYMENTYEENK